MAPSVLTCKYLTQGWANSGRHQPAQETNQPPLGADQQVLQYKNSNHVFEIV